MRKQPFCSFMLAGVSLTDFGLSVPSPFTKLSLSNSEVTSFTSWTLTCTVGGDYRTKVNVSAFEALLYSAAQSASRYANSSGIPVSFVFGWTDSSGNITEMSSYQGFTIQFNVSTSGLYMTYELVGYASLAIQTSVPVLNIPALSGFVQPSAILVGLAKATKATDYYKLDVDRNDVPTYVSHNAMTTSFNKYVRGEKYGETDDYHTFPGLVKLSKSYNSTRTASRLDTRRVANVNQLISAVPASQRANYITASNTDTALQSNTFSFWIDQPTTTSPGIIHYKSDSNIASHLDRSALQYGTADTNIISLRGSYNGVAYDISNMDFSYVGFSTDGSGQQIADARQVVNSWSNSVAEVYQTSNIVNDLNAIATQFSGDFTVEIPGTCRSYQIAEPVSLIVMSQNTLSPITGVYNIMSVSHSISSSFITSLKIQRLSTGSANQTASESNIKTSSSLTTNRSAYTTKNIVTPYYVDFGEIYPTISDIGTLI